MANTTNNTGTPIQRTIVEEGVTNGLGSRIVNEPAKGSNSSLAYGLGAIGLLLVAVVAVKMLWQSRSK